MSASKRNLQSLDAALMIARTKESRCAEILRRAEHRFAEQKNLYDTLVAYGQEYREDILSMDIPGRPLTQQHILQRKNLLAMINQVENMKMAQVAQVKIAETDLNHSLKVYQQARLYVGNLEDLYQTKKQTLQNEKIKDNDKRDNDEFLTRFLPTTSNHNY